MVKKLQDFWGGLPHWAQAIIVVFATAAATKLGEAFTDADSACFTSWPCWKASFGAAFTAGMVALRAFYMTPNRPVPPQPNPEPPKESQ